MSPEEFLETYPNYLANMREKRSERAVQMYESLTPREQALVRDAAVMGFVNGVWAAGGGISRENFPPDSKVIEEVLLLCESQSDLYPTIGGLNA